MSNGASMILSSVLLENDCTRDHPVFIYICHFPDRQSFAPLRSIGLFAVQQMNLRLTCDSGKHIHGYISAGHVTVKGTVAGPPYFDFSHNH